MPVRRSTRSFRFAPHAVAAAAGLVCTVMLAGCAVGPDYARPTVAVPANFKEAAPGWKVAQPSDQQDRGDWWAVFDDATLSTLEAKVNVSNQTIAGYEAAYRQAHALVAEARAAYFPT